MASSDHSRRRISYFYDGEIGDHHYGEGHPMKPFRIRLTHTLVLNYGLYHKMEVYRPKPLGPEELTKFHSAAYINFLRSIDNDMAPESVKELDRRMKKMRIFNVGEIDCPVFEGMFTFSQLSAGGSVAGAHQLNIGGDIAINWGGGLHHAKKSQASGFCYVNDIVLGILELLKYHQRVLYIDIDIHHGDGVEEAFFTTDRVMTVSFHKYGDDFFPGTGGFQDVGAGRGKYYSLNVPLMNGIDDDSFQTIFQPVMTKVMETYRPSAVVLQCGADSLTGDKIGCFNLTLKGHASCVDFMKTFNLPLLLLGGGGYTVKNVARCWAYETAVALGCEISNELPFCNDYFRPSDKLHIKPSDIENMNTPKYLDKVKARVFENLSRLPCAPSVPMHDIPEDGLIGEGHEEDNPDTRNSIPALDKRVAHDNEFSDSEDEGERGDRRDNQSKPTSNKRSCSPRQKEDETEMRNNRAAKSKKKVGNGPSSTSTSLSQEMKKLSHVKSKTDDEKPGCSYKATPTLNKSSARKGNDSNSKRQPQSGGKKNMDGGADKAPLRSPTGKTATSKPKPSRKSPSRKNATVLSPMEVDLEPPEASSTSKTRPEMNIDCSDWLEDV